MKAIWSTCARAFSLPGLGKKRNRGDGDELTVLPDSKRAKVGGSDGKYTDRTDIHNYADDKILKLNLFLIHE